MDKVNTIFCKNCKTEKPTYKNIPSSICTLCGECMQAHVQKLMETPCEICQQPIGNKDFRMVNYGKEDYFRCEECWNFNNFEEAILKRAVKTMGQQSDFNEIRYKKRKK